jgi:hypothetical protein
MPFTAGKNRYSSLLVLNSREGEVVPNRKSGLILVLALLAVVCIYESLQSTKSSTNVSAVQTSGTIGVYWDSSCSKTVSSIDWGTLQLGETKNIIVYARNEGTETVFLTVTASNFVPAITSVYLNFAYSCIGHKLRPNSTVQVTQALSVSSSTNGVSTFSFEMTFQGTTYVEGDLNGDGVVEMRDFVLFLNAFGSTSRDARWNPDADLNEDGVVHIYDMVLLSERWSP